MGITNVNDANFDEEVNKSKIPVVVDIWAEWCVSTDSFILTNKYDSVSAGKINRNGSVLAYDGERLREGKVIYSKTSSKNGHCKEIITELGRSINVTDEHLFYTQEGWKKADELTRESKVAVYPVVYNKFLPDKNVKTIITDSEIKNSGDGKIGLSKNIELIKNLGFLPLKTDNEKIYTISRIIGLLFSDGSLYRNASNNYCCSEFFIGSLEDAKVLVSDLKYLGFNNASIKKRVNKFKINKREIIITTYRVRLISTPFWLIMRSLGVPCGRKTDIDYEIPRWLRESSKNIKREFLAGYLGGDGPLVSFKVVSRKKLRGDYNKLNINDIEFHKKNTNIESGLKFGEQISEMLNEQGVIIRKIFTDNENYIRNDKSISKSVHISISNSYESGYALASIGYAYAWSKQKQSNYVMAFLAKKLNERRLWADKYKKAMRLYNNRKNVKYISLNLGVSLSTIQKWVKYGAKPTINYTFERYPKWLEQATKGLEDGLVWEKVENVKETYLQKVQVLTVDRYSNFIANGFLVHNCGPCRLMNPIIDEVAKEYEGKVKFVKINSDENEKTVMKFNISSIPTTLLIKNGQLKAMNVGAIPKETFKKWITQNM